MKKKRLCACGCGQLTSGRFNRHTKKYAQFIVGHNFRTYTPWNIGLTKETDQRIKNMSKKVSGKNHRLFGKHQSKKTREKMSISNSGKNNGMYGKKRSKESRKKQVIEMFGVAYRDPDTSYVKVDKKRTYQGTMEHYKKFGWDCLIIWDYELKESNKVLEKIERFVCK